jgi:hypothetical protein
MIALGSCDQSRQGDYKSVLHEGCGGREHIMRYLFCLPNDLLVPTLLMRP